MSAPHGDVWAARPAASARWRCPGTSISRASMSHCRSKASNCGVSGLPSGKNPITFRMKPVETALVSPGESFVIGETTFEVIEDPLQAGRRTATCTAIDFVQLVRIKADDFARMLASFRKSQRASRKWHAPAGRWICNCSAACSRRRSASFLEQELMQGQNLLLLDLNKCTRCDECVKACVATHDDGVTRLIRDGLRFENFLVATSCRACMDPLCMTRCPVGSIRRKDTLDIVIEDWCIGCGNCATDCPYGNINVVEVDGRAAQAEGRTAAEGRGLRSVRRVRRAQLRARAARMTPRSAWSRRRFFARDLAGVQLTVPTRSRAAAARRGRAAGEHGDQDLLQCRRAARHAAAAEDRLRAARRVVPATALSHRPRSAAAPATTTASPDDTHDVARAGGDRMRGRPVHPARSNSTNGTLVNGNPVTEIELHPGDVIEMGEMQMEFVWGARSNDRRPHGNPGGSWAPAVGVR